jgi:chorismate mutase
VAELLDVFLWSNLMLIGFNLLPVPPLDGVEAWGVIALYRASRARRRMDAEREARVRAAATEKVRSLDALEEHDLPPMPDEVKRVLERIVAEGRAQQESDKKK